MRHADRGHLPLVRERELALHVEVAREAGRDQVAGAVLDPLHRAPDQQRRGGRDDVAGVHGHLVAEAAAEVRRDDPDLVLGEPGDEREDRPVRVRRLRGHVDRRLAGRRVDVGDAAAALERRRVRARVERLEADDPVGRRERALGRLGVARLPVVNRVVGLVLLVVPDHGRAGRERLLRRRDRRAAVRSRPRSARARRAPCRRPRRSRRRPPGPACAPCRWRARPVCRRRASASRRGCAGRAARR